jgi:nucleobase:cation symporter-1, NCS1 family
MSNTVIADQPWSIELHAIQPIPSSDRHGSPIELFRLWIGANINYLVLVTGALAITQGLSLRASIAAILIGNVLGCAVVGLASITGPKTGTAGIVTSRTSFGQLGAFLPTFISTVSAIGWFSINSVIATESLAKVMTMAGLPDSALVAGAAMVIVLAGEILLAIYGHATIIAAEKYISLALILLFLGFAALLLPHIHWSSAAGVPHHGGVATWLLVTGLVFSYPLSWANFASDYSRYLPASTSWRRVAVAAAAGQLVALVVCEIIGTLFALALGGTLTDPITDLPKLLPGWYLVPFLLALIVGSIATNVPNGYTASLGLLALRLPIRRVASLLLIAAATLAFRVFTLLYGHVLDLYERWLGYILIWPGPWVSIVVVDYFLRGGSYSGTDLMQWRGSHYWYRGGVGWRGIAAFGLGLAASLAFSNSDLYASPLMTKWFGGTDLSFEGGMLVAGLLYYVLSARVVERTRELPLMASLPAGQTAAE